LKGTLGPGHPLVATLLNNVVMASGKPRRDADAEALFKRSRTIAEKTAGPNDQDIAPAR
jgi:hypothetical protein